MANALINEYIAKRKHLSHHERARLEEELWLSLSEKERKAIGGGRERPYWLKKRLGGTYCEYRSRYSLYYAGSDAELLWPKVDNEHMPIGTAVKFLAKAKRLAKQRGYEVTDALRELLYRYDEQQGELYDVYSHGKYVGKARRKSIYKGKSAWGRVTNEIAALFDQELHHLPTFESSRLKREFEVDLKLLIDNWQSKLARVRATKRAVQKIEHQQIVDACDTLVMDPPDVGKPVDLRIARRQQRRLGKLYHPDVCGNESLRPKYEAVNQAYTVLETYNESLAVGPPRPKLSIIHGGKD